MNPIDQMQTFVRVVEAGSISKAAEQLDTAKSAVSRKLSELEQRLNVTLLKRTTRRQTLTEAGERYYQQCLRLLDDIAEIEAQISDAEAALSGRIRISAPLTFGLQHLSPVLHAFRQQYPGIQLDIDFNDRRVDLIEDGFDLAVRIGRLPDSSLIARRLSTTRVLLCGSPDYFAQHGLPKTPTDLLDGHQRLQYRTAAEQWHFKDHNEETQHIDLPVLMVANNGNFLCDAAICGQGLIMMPDFICYQAIRDGRLISILEDFMPDRELGIYAVYPGTRHLSERVRVMIEFLSEYFSGESPWSLS
ncbi:LysR family transcriptional regulator [Methylophaga lonarensis]|uniref:LysR family transcriptional regulator n=1 Tax=Methylophaga lonarensis TaxID=999151 RepID=UPI003D2A2F5D